VSCLEGPVAVHLQGNKDQSKKMAAMTSVDSLGVKDVATEKKQGSSAAEEDKTKDVDDVRKHNAQIGLQEQQLEYKIRKEQEYRNQLHRHARQMAVQSCSVEDHDVFHSSSSDFPGILSSGRYTVPAQSTVRGKTLDRYDQVKGGNDALHRDIGFGASGTSASRPTGDVYSGDQSEVSSTATVRVGPGYSVLALRKPSRSSAATSESPSTWVEVSSVVRMYACQYSSVSMRLQAGWLGLNSRHEQQGFCIHHCIQMCPATHPVFSKRLQGALFERLKQLIHAVGHQSL
jgi:hypothetical protein